jgi:polysaccharide deacetylase family protein (PEP-CTERM system associated)
MITNALTVDVEDYFQVSALAPHVPRDQWDRLPCRVERNVHRLLDMFAEHDATATFFALGWIAQRYPGIIRRIVAEGHELASHGFDHLRASEQTPDQLKSDIGRAKHILEDVSGVQVRGYRAPSFSIGVSNVWAFDTIREAGYCYSSSVYPVQHDHYGMPEAPRFPYPVVEDLLEIPITTVHVLGRNFPAGGGGFFRLLPYAVSRWSIDRFNRVDGAPAVFYMHPWEIDPDQPRVPGPGLKTRFRHYVNLRRTEPRLARLLKDFRWGRIDRVFRLA